MMLQWDRWVYTVSDGRVSTNCFMYLSFPDNTGYPDPALLFSRLYLALRLPPTRYYVPLGQNYTKMNRNTFCSGSQRLQVVKRRERLLGTRESRPYSVHVFMFCTDWFWRRSCNVDSGMKDEIVMSIVVSSNQLVLCTLTPNSLQKTMTHYGFFFGFCLFFKKMGCVIQWLYCMYSTLRSRTSFQCLRTCRVHLSSINPNRTSTPDSVFDSCLVSDQVVEKMYLVWKKLSGWGNVGLDKRFHRSRGTWRNVPQESFPGLGFTLSWDLDLTCVFLEPPAILCSTVSFHMSRHTLSWRTVWHIVSTLGKPFGRFP
jgi:hypothetical protein